MAFQDWFTCCVVKETMKQLGFGVLALIFSSFLGVAQNQKFIPLLGSIQSITKSPFCKKYKCIIEYDSQKKIFTNFVLVISGDDPNDKNLETYEKTRLHFSEDKKQQLVYLQVWLREDFKSNMGTNSLESVMLADLMYYAVGGKRLPLSKSMGEDYAPAISDCFLKSRGLQKENFEPLTRVMSTGEVMLQVDKKKVKYRTVCSSRFGGSKPEYYMPAFWIEIPSIKDRQTPPYRY
jgi:hypothetical protein